MTLYEAIASEAHCLIAGATGSGKSVVINGVLHAIVSQKSPEQYSLVLIDPKRVELIEWSKLPHCLAYASELSGKRSIPDVLKQVCDEMDRRYRLLQGQGLKKWQSGHIAVIVDELADIATDNRTRDSLCRIARLGRAANIHLIVASQRIAITDKLMPAEMRANIDARLCLRVSEPKDSRMVIGIKDAAFLPIYGYGIYISPKLQGARKFNIPMVSEADKNRAIHFWDSRS